MVIGIGLNVDTGADELPVATATSLLLAGAADVDRTELLVAILTRLDARYAQWADCRGDAAAAGLAETYRSVCATLGEPGPGARSATTTPSRARRSTSTTSAGCSCGRRPATRPISAGDVEHVRSACLTAGRRNR